MQNSVNAALALCAASAVAAIACKSTTDPAADLVAAPMLSASEPIASSAPTGTRDAGGDASPGARPMAEPRPPQSARGCAREVHCEDPLLSVPPWPFPAPFERCDPDPPQPVGRFSARETTARRRDDPDTCCYVAFDNCSGRRPR